MNLPDVPNSVQYIPRHKRARTVHYGINSLGIIKTPNGEYKCRVQFMDNRFIFARRLDTNERLCVHDTYFMPIQPIPPRYRQYAFESVAFIWGQALVRYPDAVEFSSQLSPETLARKLREAREAKQRYGWTHPLIDEVLWNLHCNDICITPKATTVILGPRHAQESHEPVRATEIGKKDITINITGANDIEALCLLLHNRCIEPRPTFLVIGITDEQVLSLELRYDVGFVKLEEGKYTTI